MKDRIISYNGYVIYTNGAEERGLFFRSPLQKVRFETFYDDTFSAWDYLNRIKNPIRRLYEILIGNGKILRKIDNWSKNANWAGFMGNILCSPIYFKREYRKLTAYSCGNDNGSIQKIVSYGYESNFNICCRDCEIEKTVMHLKNGRTIKTKRRGSYYFTYEHIIKEIIDSGVSQ